MLSEETKATSFVLLIAAVCAAAIMLLANMAGAEPPVAHTERISYHFTARAWKQGTPYTVRVETLAWQRPRITVEDRIQDPGWPVTESAYRWADNTVLRLSMTTGSGPALCTPPIGVVAVCLGDFGSSWGHGRTNLLIGRRGYVVGASIWINTYWGRDFLPDERMYLLGHEFGHALGNLPHNTRLTSIMSGNLVLRPDAQDEFDMDSHW